MKYNCKSCEKEFERKEVLLIQKTITVTGPMGPMPTEFGFALCKPCAKELGYEVPKARKDEND